MVTAAPNSSLAAGLLAVSLKSSGHCARATPAAEQMDEITMASVLVNPGKRLASMTRLRDEPGHLDHSRDQPGDGSAPETGVPGGIESQRDDTRSRPIASPEPKPREPVNQRIFGPSRIEDEWSMLAERV